MRKKASNLIQITHIERMCREQSGASQWGNRQHKRIAAMSQILQESTGYYILEIERQLTYRQSMTRGCFCGSPKAQLLHLEDLRSSICYSQWP